MSATEKLIKQLRLHIETSNGLIYALRGTIESLEETIESLGVLIDTLDSTAGSSLGSQIERGVHVPSLESQIKIAGGESLDTLGLLYNIRRLRSPSEQEASESWRTLRTDAEMRVLIRREATRQVSFPQVEDGAS